MPTMPMTYDDGRTDRSAKFSAISLVGGFAPIMSWGVRGHSHTHIQWSLRERDNLLTKDTPRTEAVSPKCRLFAVHTL